MAQEGPVPVLNGLSPQRGPSSGGTLVTIYGSNFVVGSVGETKVTFGGLAGEVIEVQKDKILVKTPPHPSQGSPVDVRVENPDGQWAVLAESYAFFSSPRIDSVNPPRGSSVGGTEIELLGEQFQPGIQVYIDGKAARSVLWLNAGQVRAVTPGGSLGAKTVQVVNPDGGSFSLEGAFAYEKSTVLLESVVPQKGAGGTVITITGKEGNQFDRAAQVRVGANFAGGVTYIHEREIKAVVPPGTVEEIKDVTVINPDGAQDTLPGAFRYIIMPSISSITPNYGWVGDLITIKGTNFDKIFDPEQYHQPQVLIGGFPVEIVDATKIAEGTLLVKIIEGNLGPADVTVRNPADPEQGVTVVGGFTFTTGKSQPQVHEITPNVGSTKGGTEVTIRGEDFRIAVDGSLPVVKIGNKTAEIKKDVDGEPFVAPTQMVVISPEHTAGPKDVTITNPDGGTVTVPDGFTYKIPEKMVRITSVTPDRGTVEGGTPITVFGVNFPLPEEVPQQAQVGLFIGGNEAGEVEVLDTNTITAVTPGGYVEEGELETAQDVMIEIRRLDGQGEVISLERYTLPGGFIYRIPESQPRVDRVFNEETGDNTGPLAGGSIIRIEGVDFRSGLKVYLGKIDPANQAQVQSVETGSIRAVTPPASVAGPVDVIVINQDLGQAILKNGFVYRGTSMIITSVTPEFGPVAGGTRIRITGANFDEDTLIWIYLEDASNPENIIRYEATEVELEADSFGTALTAVTPRFTPGWKNVVVANRYGEYIYRNGFQYLIPSVDPIIDRVILENGDPARGPVIGGTAFLILGMNFVAGSAVFIGEVPAAEVVVEDETRIKVVSPPGLPGYQPVTVVSPIGKSATLENAFFYYSNPTIEKLSPAKGSTGGGNIITITGSQFYPGASVVFGSSAADCQVFHENLIKARLPAGAAGEVTVRVENVDGGSASWEGFLYQEPRQEVVIHRVFPDSGETKGGTEVFIRGEGFAPDAVVHFGWERAESVKVISPEEIRVTAPPHPPGRVDVTVSNLEDTGTAVAPEAFEYKDPLTKPRITGIFPELGPKAGGTRVVITGSDFWPGARVFIGDEEAFDLQVYHDKIYATTPPGEVGPADVRVINPDGGTAILPKAFNYKHPASKPQIFQVDPTQVPAAGGQPVTILGADFREGVKVYFDGLASPQVDLLSEGKIIAVTPPHPPGKVDLIVVNDDGGNAHLPQGVEYLAPQSEPVVFSLEPDRGPVDGGTPVVIHGKDFREGIKVFFNGIPAPAVELLSYKELRVITPPGREGPADVTVMNTGEHLGSFTLKNAFTYVTSNPKIVSINPSQGVAGTEAYLLGEDFREGARVFFGEVEVPAQDLRVESQERVWVKVPAQERTGYFDVRLVNPDGAEALLKQGFRYRLPDSRPVVKELSPSRGPVIGHIIVTIIGEDFRDQAEVYFGGITALSVEVIDGNTIRAKIPPHSPGPKDVTVTNYDGGTHTLTAAFTYEEPDSEPQIFRVEPNKGPAVGETAITISGNDFRPGALVYIGGVPAREVVVENYQTIRALTPPGEEGPKDVTVINPDQGAATLAKGFTYYAIELPVIYGLDPDRVKVREGRESPCGAKDCKKALLFSWEAGRPRRCRSRMPRP